METQSNGVANRFERKGVIGHAGHHAEINHGATGQNDVVVRYVMRLAVVPFVLNHLVIEVNPLHVFGAAMDGWQELAQGRCHRIRVDRGPRHFGQQRMKHHVVVRVE